MNSANYGKHRGWWLLVIGLVLTINASAQRTTYRISFVDKGDEAFVPGSTLYEQTLSTFHARALARRSNLGKQPLLDSLDRPIEPAYLTALAGLGVEDVYGVSFWRNCVLADLDTLTANQVAAQPFVKSIVHTSLQDYQPQLDLVDCSPARPGSSYGPHGLMNTLRVLDAGVTGKGARVCLIDNGFRIADMSSLQHLDVAETFDFIYNDDDVGNKPGEPSDQDGHGSLVLSVAAGWEQDSLIGIAPFATYLLAKTEDMRWERRVEEDLYVAAVEWAERNGADVISSSLGYFGYDAGEDTLSYDDLDGKTTFASQAINRAVALGVVNITAAGNSGPAPRTLGIPADADSVITVGGASWPDKDPYFFTSQGPTADGRQKPEIAAQGLGVRAQGLDGTYIRASGTSMAAPQIAGVMAMARQLYPEVPTWELRRALYASASIADSIGDFLGYGLPDVLTMLRMIGEQFGPGIGPPAVVEVDGVQRVLFTVFSTSFADAFLILDGRSEPLIADVMNDLYFNVDVAANYFTSDTIRGRLRAVVNGLERFYPSDSTWFALQRKGSVIPCGMRLPSFIVGVNEPPRSTQGASARIAPTPTPHGQRRIELLGIRDAHTISLFETSTGAFIQHLDVQHAIDGRILLTLPTLASGAYRIAASTATGPVSLPLIIH